LRFESHFLQPTGHFTQKVFFTTKLISLHPLQPTTFEQLVQFEGQVIHLPATSRNSVGKHVKHFPVASQV